MQTKPIELATHSGQEFDLVVKGTLKIRIGDHVEILYKDNGSGERVLSFRNLTYSIKDKDADTSGSGSNG